MNPARRKKIGLIIGIAVLCLAWYLYSLIGPNPPIVVSRETTHITEPLGDDGLPDYIAHWMQMVTGGVTPEKNAAALHCSVLGPGYLDKEDWHALCATLGVEVPSEDEGFVEFDSVQVRERIATWLADQYEMPDEMDVERWRVHLRDATADSAVYQAMDRPWTAKQLLPLAEWISENKQRFDLLVTASLLPQYHSGWQPVDADSDESLLAVALPTIQYARMAIRVLELRAMFCVGEGRLEEAWEDLSACYRLARLYAQEPTFVSQLIGIAVDGDACSGTQVLLLHQSMDERLARRILVELTSLKEVSNMGWSTDQGERLLYLDIVIRLAEGKISASKIFEFSFEDYDSGPAILLSKSRLDWNVVLKAGNQWYDRFVAALKIESRTERDLEIDLIEQDLDRLSNEVSPLDWISALFSRNQRSKMMADSLALYWISALGAQSRAQDRSLATLELTRVAAALAVYRAQHGEYPENLAALVPDILPEFPLDLYSDKPFHYQRKPDGGYLLYSVGDNGIDDGGTDYTGEIVSGEWVDQSQVIEMDKSDLVIRVPVPPFRLPEPIVDE